MTRTAVGMIAAQSAEERFSSLALAEANARWGEPCKVHSRPLKPYPDRDAISARCHDGGIGGTGKALSLRLVARATADPALSGRDIFRDPR